MMVGADGKKIDASKSQNITEHIVKSDPMLIVSRSAGPH